MSARHIPDRARRIPADWANGRVFASCVGDAGVDHNLAELRSVAIEIAACIDEVAGGGAELLPGVAETAAACAILMGLGTAPE